MLKKDIPVVKYALKDGLTTKAVWDAFDRIKKFVEEAQNTSTNKQSASASQIAEQVKRLYNEMPPRDYSREEVVTIVKQLHTL